MPNKLSEDDRVVTVKLSVIEHKALIKAADTGFAVVDALHLVANTRIMEQAVMKLRNAR